MPYIPLSDRRNSPTSSKTQLRRTPSFDVGDDTSMPPAATDGGRHGRGVGSAGLAYRSSQSPSSQNHGLPTHYSPGNASYMGNVTPNNQPGATSPPIPMRPAYNPQQYGLSSNTQTLPASVANIGTYNTVYQSYNPAAYHNTGQSIQSGYTRYDHSTHADSPAPLPPPPPPRPSDNQYASRVSPNTLFSSQSSEMVPALPPRTHTFSSVTTSSSGASRQNYTPPAPPAPPFNPAQDAFPSPPPPHSASTSHRAVPSENSRAQDYSTESRGYRATSPPFAQYRPDRYAGPVPTHLESAYGNIPHASAHAVPASEIPGPTPPAHSPRRSDTLGRHPQARPLPGPPPLSPQPDYFGIESPSSYSETAGYDDLMQEVEAAVMGRPPPPSRRSGGISYTPQQSSRIGPNTRGSSMTSLNDRVGSVSSSHASHTATSSTECSDDSDAEAQAGLAAMHLADEQDARDAARRRQNTYSTDHSSMSGRSQRRTHGSNLSGSGSDVQEDMSTYGAAFPGGYHYGERTAFNEYSDLYEGTDRSFHTGDSSLPSYTPIEDSSRDLYDYTIPDEDYIHPFAPARVDTGGTGGLSEPSERPRRHSFDEGDEANYIDADDAYTSGESTPPGEGMSMSTSSRPLPMAPDEYIASHLIPAGTYRGHTGLAQRDQDSSSQFPTSPDMYSQLHGPLGVQVPRSSSLVSHGSQPQATQFIRAKTDSERAKILRQQQVSRVRSSSIYGTEGLGNTALNSSADLLDLPAIPLAKRRRYNPAKLSSEDYEQCREPWALSSVVTWLRHMCEGEADLKEGPICDGIINLFTHKVPTMNTADAEALGAKVVRAMYDSGALIKDEEWVKFGSAELVGVLYQLTGTGCYSLNGHTAGLPGRCYAHHCMRTLKKVNLQTHGLEPQRKAEDWVTFYKLKKEDLENVDRKEIERQNNLHEIVTTEDNFMDQLNVLRILYRDELSKWEPPIIAPKRKESFLKDVFGKVDAIKQVNEDYLLAQLKYRQQEQGPWIIGFSDIFREWIRKAKTAYIDYAASFPNATYLVRQEADRNVLFSQFLDQMRDNERSKRLGWDTYLKAPITRLQRYGLLLSTVDKHMLKESDEKTNLRAAMEEIKAVTMECDARVAEMAKTVDLSELANKLKLRSEMSHVHLNLTHLGREVIFRGDLQRMGSAKFTWVDAHAILFDHYFVLAKIVEERSSPGGQRSEKYDVSKLPVPMDLLVLESTNDDPVIKSTMKGLGSVTTVTSRAGVPSEPRTNRQSMPSQSPNPLTHVDSSSSISTTKTNASTKTMVATTVIDNSKDEKIMYPFRIRHLGKAEVYILYAPTQQNRQDWCKKILEAKTRHAASLYKQNAEPFRLRVIADTAFACDALGYGSRGLIIRGTPLDRAIKDSERAFGNETQRPTPVCRAAVNCATAFVNPKGTRMIAVGTDFGVFITEYESPRGWSRAIASTRVTQISVLEDFGLFLILADKQLIAHHLDTVVPGAAGNAALASNSADSSSRRAPQKLSGARDIGFFAQGRMKDRQLVFYKKREGVSSIFKILEPVYQKSSSLTGGSTMRTRLGGMVGRKGTTEFFRDFDDFYIASETYGINLFQSSLAVSTTRGIEVMNLEKKQPFTIPELKSAEVASIAARIRDQRPLGMFRLSENEYLLIYEGVGIYVNKHGEVSRSVILDFIGRAKQACLVDATYLILVDHLGLYVEVRNAINGRLRQVISGRDVRLLDDGNHGHGTVKICMQHPELDRSQIVLELLVNQGLKE